MPELGRKAKPSKRLVKRSKANGDLSDTEKAFIAHYVTNGYNAVRAAMSCGIKCKNYNTFGQMGHIYLKKLKVRAAIDEHFRAAGMGKDEVLARLVEQIRANPTDFFDKRWRLKHDQMQRNGHLVRKFKAPSRGKPAEIELHDQQAALIRVGQHLGLWKDNVQNVGDSGGPVRHEFIIVVRPVEGAALPEPKQAVVELDPCGPKQLEDKKDAAQAAQA